MNWGAAIGGLASLAGSFLGNRAAEKASDAQSDAARQNAELYRYMYDQNRTDLEPWRTTGVNALRVAESNAMAPSERTSFGVDPGYQFRMDEGLRAIRANMASRGLLNSGALDRASGRYASDLASQEYGNWWNRDFQNRQFEANRVSQLAGIGQQAVQQGVQSGQFATQGIAGANTAGGQAVADGAIRGANAWNAGIGNLNALLAYSGAYDRG